jgi:hypothetical protein
MEENTQTVVERLKNYYDMYQKGKLKNEPARLICEYLDARGEEDYDSFDEKDLQELIAEALSDRYLGTSGEIGGVNVNLGCEGEDVQYVTGYECTWMSFDSLCYLAKVADETGDESPCPDWFEDEWKGLKQELAEQIVDEMSYEEAEKLADMLDLSEENEDSGKEYRCYFEWIDDPKEAIKVALDTQRMAKKYEILSGYLK